MYGFLIKFRNTFLLEANRKLDRPKQCFAMWPTVKTFGLQANFTPYQAL